MMTIPWNLTPSAIGTAVVVLGCLVAFVMSGRGK